MVSILLQVSQTLNTSDNAGLYSESFVNESSEDGRARLTSGSNIGEFYYCVVHFATGFPNMKH